MATEREHYNWEGVPAVVIRVDGVTRAGFMKTDLYEAWRSCNPLQVRGEGEFLPTRQWKRRFKPFGVDTVPKLKDFSHEDMYLEPYDDWKPKSEKEIPEPTKAQLKAADALIPIEKRDDKKLFRPERFEWQEGDLEVVET